MELPAVGAPRGAPLAPRDIVVMTPDVAAYAPHVRAVFGRIPPGDPRHLPFTLADRRAREGRSVIGNAWVYTLSMGVYCTAWTYFGSIGRAASSGLWFLPIYLGPMLAMILAWLVVRKMIRIARAYRITVRASGIRAATVVMLQSVYVKQ